MAGDDTHDVACTLCPPGTYRNASLFAEQDGSGGAIVSCRECPAGTYTDQPGATACKPCTDCLSPTVSIGNDCPFSPASQHCERAIKTPCSASQDAQCTMCPSLSVQGGFEKGSDDGICRPCKLGYYYNQSQPVEGRRCVPCAPGFYCPSKDQYVACPGTSIFQRQGAAATFVTVPETTPRSAASSLDQCNCSLAGGFEASTFSQALFGCVPCEDGYYAVAGQHLKCQRCPSGTYSSQTRGVRNYAKCPSSVSPRITFYGAAGTDLVSSSTGALCTADPADAAVTMTVGATSCTPCPTDRPFTREGAVAKSLDDCWRCPDDHFFDTSLETCVRCRPACKHPNEFELAQCTENHDR